VYDLFIELDRYESLRFEESSLFRISIFRSVLEIEGSLLFEVKIKVSLPIFLLDILLFKEEL
jgi:hypothetical protein